MRIRVIAALGSELLHHLLPIRHCFIIIIIIIIIIVSTELMVVIFIVSGMSSSNLVLEMNYYKVDRCLARYSPRA